MFGIGVGVGLAPSGVGRFGAECTPVTSAAPNQPTIYAGTITSTTWNLSSSLFSDPDAGDTHLYTDWEVATDAGFVTIVWSSLGNTTNKTSIQATGLATSTAHWARCRHADASSVESANATAVTDTTLESGGVSPIFEDSFETANYKSTGGGIWTWGYNGPESFPEPYDNYIGVYADSPRTGAYASIFQFPAKVPTATSWLEQDFDYPQTTKFWLEYYLKIPSNYYHNNDGASASQNKFLFIWGNRDSYSNPDGRPMVGFELWPITPAGDSKLRIMISTTGSAGTVGWVDPAISASGPLYRNQYNRIRVHADIGTSGNKDATYKVWLGDTLVYSWENFLFWPTNEPTYPYFDTGYVMGYCNAGYPVSTRFHIDDWKFYTTNPGW